ncbi:mobilization protein MobD [Marinobacterium aestuarii]|uniref:Mobilization protein MobD n=1 Tax=Marinobacterium aestuarii TaxID=1821621 RepID=A0A1A9F2T5_9GAMM|nr:mobilization protein MobD [Marinobacterium aestuarii]ANG64614.1 mobilization protein MobD [Marinobacterium aestuarii]
MSSIHFIGGEKGGVGKSVLSRLLSQYFLDRGQPYLGLDADQSHATLSRFYPQYTRPVNLDSFDSIDQIMEFATEGEQQILIDLPAQSERFLDRWIDENGVLDMCAELQIPLLYWYIVDDGLDSVALLETFLAKYGSRMNIAVIKNEGRGTNFATIDAILHSDPATAGGSTRHAALPALHRETMRKIDELSFSFWGAENIKDKNLEHLSLMERQRTRVWIKKTYALFDELFIGQPC